MEVRPGRALRPWTPPNHWDSRWPEPGTIGKKIALKICTKVSVGRQFKIAGGAQSVLEPVPGRRSKKRRTGAMYLDQQKSMIEYVMPGVTKAPFLSPRIGGAERPDGYIVVVCLRWPGIGRS